MLGEDMIQALDSIAIEASEGAAEVETITYWKCECVGGCTDACYDCATISTHRW